MPSCWRLIVDRKGAPLFAANYRSDEITAYEYFLDRRKLRARVDGVNGNFIFGGTAPGSPCSSGIHPVELGVFPVRE